MKKPKPIILRIKAPPEHWEMCARDARLFMSGSEAYVVGALDVYLAINDDPTTLIHRTKTGISVEVQDG